MPKLIIDKRGMSKKTHQAFLKMLAEGLTTIDSYGINKSTNKDGSLHRWETFAWRPDGKDYATSLTWAVKWFKTRKEAKKFIDNLADKHGWPEDAYIEKVNGKAK